MGEKEVGINRQEM